MVFGRVPIGCSLRNSTPALLLQIGQTQILWPPAKWHTLCPPHSILFILGAVSPVDEAAVLRERDLLQLRANSLHGLGQTSRFCGDDASSGRLFRKKAALTKAPSPFFFQRQLRAWRHYVQLFMYKSSPPGVTLYRNQNTKNRFPAIWKAVKSS